MSDHADAFQTFPVIHRFLKNVDKGDVCTATAELLRADVTDDGNLVSVTVPIPGNAVPEVFGGPTADEAVLLVRFSTAKWRNTFSKRLHEVAVFAPAT